MGADPMRHSFTDPATGDTLTLGEEVSWQIQGIIRRWLFLIIIIVVTAVCWVVGSAVADVLTWWNLAASLMALIIESVVGIAMFSQTKRDAKIIRGLRDNVQRMHVARIRDEERARLQLMYLIAWHHDIHGDTCHCWLDKRDRADQILDEFTATPHVTNDEMVGYLAGVAAEQIPKEQEQAA